MLHSDLTGGRPVFHVFSLHGDIILLDARTSQAVFVDHLIYELLQLVEEGMSLDEAGTISATRFGEEAVSQAIEDLIVLRDQLGFFQLETLSTPDALQRRVESLNRHHPRSMMLLVSRSCNLKCTYCYEVVHEWHRPGDRMRATDMRVAVDEFIARSGPRKDLKITFFGGEALLNFDLIREAVAYAREAARQAGKSVYFTLTTNGTLLTEEIDEFLVDNEFGVMVSLDGEEEAHDRYRRDLGGNGTHDVITTNVRRLLERQLKAGVLPLKLRATLTRENADAEPVREYFESFKGARQEIGVTTEAVSSATRADVDWSERPDLQDDLETKAQDALEAILRGANNHIVAAFAGQLRDIHEAIQLSPPPTMAEPKLCGLGRNMRAVTPSGDVYPCHRFVGMDEYRLRDGFEEPEEHEQGRARTLYRKILELFENHCGKCWARFRCGGLCTWYLADPSGTLQPPPAKQCDGIRASWERAIWLYMQLGRRAPERLAALVGSPHPPTDNAAHDQAKSGAER